MGLCAWRLLLLLAGPLQSDRHRPTNVSPKLPFDKWICAPSSERHTGARPDRPMHQVFILKSTARATASNTAVNQKKPRAQTWQLALFIVFQTGVILVCPDNIRSKTVNHFPFCARACTDRSTGSSGQSLLSGVMSGRCK